MAAGYVWRFFNPGGLDRHRVRHTLSTTVLYFFMPALAFGLLATASIDRSFFLIPLVALLAAVLCTAAGFAVYRMVPWFRNIPRPAFGVMVLAATYGNVTYLGLPVITEVLGAQSAYVAILYDLLAHTPLLLTFGAFISARYGSGKMPSASASLKRVVTLPPLWGVAAGIAVNMGGVPVPRVLLDTTALMGKAVIPIMTFTVGLALDFHDMKRLPLAAPALAIKLLLSPILVWRIGSWLGLTSDVLKAVTIEGAMPVMVVSLVIADELGLDVPLAAACIAFSTAALFFTMPLMMRVLF
ncbi:MAG TPA: AEC family transporter [Nitrospirota bacterium]|nr:AEC family transporter [Nitrospirota bacterium]